MPIARFVLEHASTRPRQVAVSCGERIRTYAELAGDVGKAARAFAADGLARGTTARAANDVVAIEVSDPLDALTTVLAADLLGATPLVCDPSWAVAHRDHILETIRPAARVAVLPSLSGADGVEVLRASGSSVPVRSSVPVASAGKSMWAGFTSGSAGRPRAIVRTGASWTDSFAAVSQLTGVTSDDTVLVPGPLSSSLYAFAALHTLGVGATLSLLPPGRSGYARALSVALAGADVVHLVPHALAGLADDDATGLPDRLRTAVVGGAALPAGVRERAAEAGVNVVAYYGAAELSFVAVDTNGAGLRPFPGVEIDVRPEPGADLGEVWVRSPWIAGGYLAGATGPLRRDAVGWASVGDLARPGRPLRLRGRSDGAVVTGGATVVPEDVESVLRAVPGVTDVVVVATAHERLGAVVTAVVESGAAGIPRSALEAAARARLAPAQRPRRWLEVRTLPRTSSGKPARAVISADVAAGRLPTGTVP